MKYVIPAIFLLFTFIANAQEHDNVQETDSSGYVSFEKFVKHIEGKGTHQFFFKKEWIDGIRIQKSILDLTVPEILEKTLIPLEMSYVFGENNSVIILPDNNFVGELPDYGSENQKMQTEAISAATDRKSNEFLVGRKPGFVETIVIGSSDKARPGKRCKIEGRIVDKETKEPLVGATVFIPELGKGAATNGNGILSFSLKPGSYAATFQCLGQKESKAVLKVISEGTFNFELEKELISINEVTVKADEIKERGSKAGLEMVSISTIRELPTLMGEKNVLQIAQMLPGIVSVGEGSGGINVRGGNADQNLFYINEVPIYNSTHLFGFFSAVNSAIVDNFSIYKGQIPAEYGGRLSSVFNIETRVGNTNNFFTQGGISPVSAQASIETPIVKDKVSIMLSGRSSYSDWILGQLDDPALKNSSTSFYDFAGSINYNIDKDNELSLFTYTSNDKFLLDDVTEFEYSNRGGSVKYNHRFNERLKTTIRALGSQYRFMTVDMALPSQSYQHDYRLNHYELKANLDWILNEYHHVKLGMDGILYKLDRGGITPYGLESKKQELDMGEEKGVESAIFVGDDIQLASRLKMYAGLRYSLFSALGPQTVYNYNENAPLDPINISDSVLYRNNEVIKNYGGPELRLALDYQLSSESAIKMSFTQMRQYLFLLSNTFSITPYDQWKTVDAHIKPPRSMQLSAGYFYNDIISGLSFSTELYYKKAKNIVEYKDGADFLSSSNIESNILQGDQRAYGAEFMIKKDVGRLNGWASYTYSRSLIKVDGENDFEDINRGNEYPSNYDKPHVVNVLLNYKLNRRFSFSSNLAYNTGRPITLPEGIYYIDGQPFVEYSERNSYRIPDYFRIDASIKIEGNLKKRKRFHSYWVASVYNLTGRENANTVFFKSENGVINGYKYSVIGVPVYTISWNWKLGNYGND